MFRCWFSYFMPSQSFVFITFIVYCNASSSFWCCIYVQFHFHINRWKIMASCLLIILSINLYYSKYSYFGYMMCIDTIFKHVYFRINLWAGLGQMILDTHISSFSHHITFSINKSFLIHVSVNQQIEWIPWIN